MIDKLTDEEKEIIDYHMNMLLYGPVYTALEKMFKGYVSQAKEIARLTERMKMYEGLAVGNAVRFETAEDKLELAVKALKAELKAAKTWDRYGTVKHIESALSSINSLGGNETP